MKNILKCMDLLDQKGKYKYADIFLEVFIKTSSLYTKNNKFAASPYGVALDELPYGARNVKWDRNKEDFTQYDTVFWQELKQRIPEYQHLNTDPDEEHNLEGKLSGQDDPVPGPAFTWPDEGGVSPSMNGDLDSFTWEESHDSNSGPDYWKNLQPRR